MSEALTTELLVGHPIRDRHGITCCPAICEEDGKQFYIKTIRIPASAVQASGLLLSGAYENAAQVQEYYRSVADSLCKEAELLKELQINGGFLAFDSWDLSALENGIGFHLTLRSKRYEGIIGREWTYQDAISLGLDLCNALTACRQKGYLYADLKPENIFTDENDGFCIGDLGLLPIESLQYTSLPEKYRSVFTAPEVADIYATVSFNADVYALGLILYWIFNETTLPQGELTPAVHADYELWKIISTACDPDPLQRYEDPAQMGKALLDYLQEFGAGDQLIGLKASAANSEPQDNTLFLTEAENDAMLADLLARIPDEQAPTDVADAWMAAETADDDLEIDQMMAQADELISHQLPQPVVAPMVIDVQLPQPVQTADKDETVAAQTPAVISIPEESAVEDTPLTEAVPEPVLNETEPDDADEENEQIWDAPKKVNIKRIVIVLSSIVVALALLIGGAALYDHLFYTKTVDDLVLTVRSDSVTVQIQSAIDDTLLTVVCTNSYGHTVKSPVKNAQATISGLNPNTTYTVSLQISGFHRLSGKISEIFATPDTIKVSDLTAVTDVWQGSVKLNFVASGNNSWTVRYFADGEPEKSVSFEGAELSITGLTVGKEYTFILETQNGAPFEGSNQVLHTVR